MSDKILSDEDADRLANTLVLFSSTRDQVSGVRRLLGSHEALRARVAELEKTLKHNPSCENAERLEGRVAELERENAFVHAYHRDLLDAVGDFKEALKRGQGYKQAAKIVVEKYDAIKGGE